MRLSHRKPAPTRRYLRVSSGKAQNDEAVKIAALSLLASGEATCPEVAALAKSYNQLIRYWASRAGIRARVSRAKRLEAIWREALLSAEHPAAVIVDGSPV